MNSQAKFKDEDARRFQRHFLIYYLRVFDRKTGEILGHLVDLAEGGVMLMRDQPFTVGASHEMRLRWRNAEGRLRLLDFGGICRWCHPDVNPDFYAAGFEITSIQEDDRAVIKQLINDLGLPE